MNMTEIEKREQRVKDAKQKLEQAKRALRTAQEEYAEQEARKAGIVYGVTKVAHSKKTGQEFLVVGMKECFMDKPRYDLRKIKKDGTPSASASGIYLVPLRDLTPVGKPS